MPDTTSTVQRVQVPRSLWTGRLDFDLMNARDWRVATVEIVVRIDSITLWCVNRTLAVMDRDLFGQWLVNPLRALAVDDVVWTVQGLRTYLTVDNRISYPVPRPTVEQLLGVI